MIHGHVICHGEHPISHLLFADYLILFCKATVGQGRAVKNVLGEYNEASGQKVNVDKSCIFSSKGVPSSNRDHIIAKMDFREVLVQEKYLGSPTYIVRSKKRAFLPIKVCIGKHPSG